MKGENSMNRMLMTTVAALALLVSSMMLWGHEDERLHGANAVSGQVTAASAGGMELKVGDNTMKIKFSSKTKFEHDKKAVDKGHIKVGGHAGVIGNKQPNGEWMANEVLLGLAAPAAAAAPKGGGAKKEADHKH